MLEAWLWVNAAASLFGWYVCDWDGAGNWCSPAGPVLQFLFRLAPMNLQLGFPRFLPEWAINAVLVCLTGACHWAVRRYFPLQLRMWQLAAVWAGWFLVSQLAFGLSLFAMWAWYKLGVV